MDLETVRHELETLVLARGLGELRAIDKERYRELCEMERALLAGAPSDRGRPVLF
jgi:hypothetical protein